MGAVSLSLFRLREPVSARRRTTIKTVNHTERVQGGEAVMPVTISRAADARALNVLGEELRPRW
jgi:hypothetical protein